MKVGSLFSGIGGFDLGLERAGFEVAFQCDNNPFCNKVLEKHWPGVPRYDDVRNIGAATVETIRSVPYMDVIIPGYRPTIDLICGGFPCQDLSVAGKRAGLAGDRSGLWFEFHRVLSELRPTLCLIENVPGLLSSNQGRDFAIVLDGLGQLWPAVGWAILDSQHFGVPQRRRRVYVIAGPSRACVQQILSLCEGGDWHSPARREAGQDVAYALNASVRKSGDGHGNLWNSNYVANPLPGHHPRQDLDNDTYITHTLSADGFDASEDGTGRGTPLVAFQAKGDGATSNLSPTLRALEYDESHANSGWHVGVPEGARTVRRLTPVECERLQGFPDNWTLVDDKTPDGPRYKACGNAVTVPVIEYLGLRIREVLS